MKTSVKTPSLVRADHTIPTVVDLENDAWQDSERLKAEFDRDHPESVGALLGVITGVAVGLGGLIASDGWSRHGATIAIAGLLVGVGCAIKAVMTWMTESRQRVAWYETRNKSAYLEIRPLTNTRNLPVLTVMRDLDALAEYVENTAAFLHSLGGTSTKEHPENAEGHRDLAVNSGLVDASREAFRLQADLDALDQSVPTLCDADENRSRIEWSWHGTDEGIRAFYTKLYMLTDRTVALKNRLETYASERSRIASPAELGLVTPDHKTPATLEGDVEETVATPPSLAKATKANGTT